MAGLQCWKQADRAEVEADFLRAEGDILRHILLPLCDVSFLRAGCRELRNPTQRAGHIPLSGLVFAHSRHNRVFDAHGETVGTKKPRLSGAGNPLCEVFLRHLCEAYGGEQARSIFK